MSVSGMALRPYSCKGSNKLLAVDTGCLLDDGKGLMKENIVGMVIYDGRLDNSFIVELPAGDGLQEAPGIGSIEEEPTFYVLSAAAAADPLDERGILNVASS